MARNFRRSGFRDNLLSFLRAPVIVSEQRLWIYDALVVETPESNGLRELWDGKVVILNSEPSNLSPATVVAWYCVQTAPKQESKVVKLLEREVGVEVFAPKIRFRRNRGGQPIWWTEALFPGYVFARFDYFLQHRQIRALPGISTIVHFGDKPALLADDILTQLRQVIGESDTVVVTGVTEPDSEVIVVSGPLRGLRLLVTRVMPARERIAVLLEILGMEREVELDAKSAVPVNPRAM